MPLSKRQIYCFTTANQTVLEILHEVGCIQRLPFVYAGAGRTADEAEWRAEIEVEPAGERQFRVDLGQGSYEAPPDQDYFSTDLLRLWLQDGQIFDYHPAPSISPARVEKIESFSGSLSPRPIYIYLPRGYDQHPARRYPVLYMHDGQNCFEAFVRDSFAGTWRADETASRLIGQGRMRECLIVAVGHGERERVVEYLPPYVSHRPASPSVLRKAEAKGLRLQSLRAKPILGRADQTAAYYRYEVAEYINRTYRVLPRREHTATCGSSMGGLFSLYLAWERTEFARHHAAMSPSFWMTKTHASGLEAIERLRSDPARDIRLWLDSGTQDTPDHGDDGMLDTMAAREALLENGYCQGPDFQYYLDEGATHSEAAWAARLPLVFQFLFPIKQESRNP